MVNPLKLHKSYWRPVYAILVIRFSTHSPVRVLFLEVLWTPLAGYELRSEVYILVRILFFHAFTLIVVKFFNVDLLRGFFFVPGLLVIIALMFCTPYLYYIPKSALAAIIIAAVIFMVEVRVVRPIYRSKSKYTPVLKYFVPGPHVVCEKFT